VISTIFSIALLCGAAAPQESDNDPLPPGVKVHVADISAHIAGIEQHIADVKLNTANTQSSAVAIGAGKQDTVSIAAGVSAKEDSKSIVLELAADILFDFDRSILKPTAQAALSKIADLIRSRANGGVKIDGYTDAKGSDQYNQKLSQARAESVRRWMLENGDLAKINFLVEGHGATHPVARNTMPDGRDDPNGRQKNRRVEITIMK
jgi:outer membrane protein OmpA-like peptidoglycan-associated protein